MHAYSGSDSAPHPLHTKTSPAQNKPPAGVFTQPVVTQLVLLAIEEAAERRVIAEGDVSRERLEGFLGRFGRRFYGLGVGEGVGKGKGKKIVLESRGERVCESVRSEVGGLEVGISRAGEEVWSLRWEAA